MKTYELAYIVSPDITSEEAEAKGKEIEAVITGKEGTILKQLNPTAKTFAYPIGKKASGFLGVIEFQLESEKLLELKEILEKDKKVVRHMISIKRAAEFKKERRTRKVAETKTESVVEEEVKAEETPVVEVSEKVEEEPVETKTVKTKEKEKVELKDIEHELDEILG